MSTETAPPPSGQTSFGERFVIDTKQPLPEFSTPGGDAFVLKDQEKPGRVLYGLVHHPTVQIRNDVFKKLASANVPNLITPTERGIMNLSLGGGEVQRLVTVFDRPTGGPLMGPDGQVNPKVQPAKLRQTIVLSMLKALAALHKKGIMHRSIKPTHLYFVAPDSDEVVVGECYSCPPGYGMPDALDPIELAMAHDRGRGDGNPLSDFYQVGAAVMCLFHGEALWVGRKRDNLIMARINQGSYWALSGGRDLPGALGALVRGLMADEEEERWGAEDVLDWFEGLTKQKRVGLKTWAMNRPTNFKGVAYVDRRLLADAFARDPREAARFLKKLDFPVWAQTSMRDTVLNDRLEQMLGLSAGKRPRSGYGEDEKLVARMCMFLHPSGPVRFKGLSVFVDGIGSMLSHAFAADDREMIAAFSEMLDFKLLSTLGEIAGDANPSFANQVSAIRRAIPFALNKSLGKGMERVLYELNPVLPCISQRFTRSWVGSVKQMLPALDRLSGAGGGKNILLDRHVAAFTAAHGRDLERVFNTLSAAQNDPARFSMLVADFFGNLQKSLKVSNLPNLTDALVGGLAPAIKQIRNRKKREAVQALLEKVKKGGDISKLTSEVNLIKVAAEDSREFAKARSTIIKLEREKIKLSRKIGPLDPEARSRGYRAVRTLAFVTLVIVVSLTVL